MRYCWRGRDAYSLQFLFPFSKMQKYNLFYEFMVESSKCVQIGNLCNVFHDNLLRSLQIDVYLHPFSIMEGGTHSKSALLHFLNG
ncbi:hypothetical protein ASL11_05860 [Paenibacillus sp. Soil750]|nr:hypothetical protein ASL11_05860 [Paenibacillus sp. Soil750]